MKSRSVQGRSYLNFTCFCFHPVSYSVFLELSQTTVEPVGELFPFRARLSDRVLGRGSRGPTRLQDRKEQAETSEEGHVSWINLIGIEANFQVENFFNRTIFKQFLNNSFHHSSYYYILPSMGFLDVYFVKRYSVPITKNV